MSLVQLVSENETRKRVYEEIAKIEKRIEDAPNVDELRIASKTYKAYVELWAWIL